MKHYLLRLHGKPINGAGRYSIPVKLTEVAAQGLRDAGFALIDDKSPSLD